MRTFQFPAQRSMQISGFKSSYQSTIAEEKTALQIKSSREDYDVHWATRNWRHLCRRYRRLWVTSEIREIGRIRIKIPHALIRDAQLSFTNKEASEVLIFRLVPNAKRSVSIKRDFAPFGRKQTLLKEMLYLAKQLGHQIAFILVCFSYSDIKLNGHGNLNSFEKHISRGLMIGSFAKSNKRQFVLHKQETSFFASDMLGKQCLLSSQQPLRTLSKHQIYSFVSLQQGGRDFVNTS